MKPQKPAPEPIRGGVPQSQVWAQRVAQAAQLARDAQARRDLGITH